MRSRISTHALLISMKHPATLQNVSVPSARQLRRTLSRSSPDSAMSLPVFYVLMDSVFWRMGDGGPCPTSGPLLFGPLSSRFCFGCCCCYPREPSLWDVNLIFSFSLFYLLICDCFLSSVNMQSLFYFLFSFLFYYFTYFSIYFYLPVYSHLSIYLAYLSIVCIYLYLLIPLFVCSFIMARIYYNLLFSQLYHYYIFIIIIFLRHADSLENIVSDTQDNAKNVRKRKMVTYANKGHFKVDL